MSFKSTVYAIVDYGKTPYRPTFMCKQTRAKVEGNQVTEPERTVSISFDVSGISINPIQDNDPDYGDVTKAMEHYKKQYNRNEKKPVILGPFTADNYIDARNLAIKEQLKHRPKSLEERAAEAEIKASKAETTIAEQSSEIEKLKKKIADAEQANQSKK